MKKLSLLLICIMLLLTGCSEAVEITYPKYLFETEQALEETAESMRGSEGMKKVTINEDGTLTLKMSEERYQKVLDAAYNTVVSLPVYAIAEDTAVRDIVNNEDFTEFTITVNPEHENAEKEINFVTYAVKLYHVCNKSYDKEVTVHYINEANGLEYREDFFTADGNKNNRNDYYNGYLPEDNFLKDLPTEEDM